MDKTQIDTVLNRLFHEQGKRIVFWNDPQREFEDALAALAVPDIKVVRLDQEGALAVKSRVEREDPTGRYLIYAPTPEPDYDDDWLLDIRLCSHVFRADRASIILGELGLANQALRRHIEERKKFFDNQERFKKLQALVSPQDTELDLDRKMLAVLVRADQPDLFTIVLALFHSLAGFPVSGVSYTQTRSKPGVLREDALTPSLSHPMGEGGRRPGEGEDDWILHDKGEPDLGTPPPAWEFVAKHGLDGAFWHMVKTTFGYAEDTPNRDAYGRLSFDRPPRGHLGATGCQRIGPRMESTPRRLASRGLPYSAFTRIAVSKLSRSLQGQLRQHLQATFIAVSPKGLDPKGADGNRAGLEPITTPIVRNLAQVLIEHCSSCWDHFVHVELNARTSDRARLVLAVADLNMSA